MTCGVCIISSHPSMIDQPENRTTIAQLSILKTLARQDGTLYYQSHLDCMMTILRHSLEEIEYDPDDLTVGTNVHEHLFEAMSKVVSYFPLVTFLIYDA